MRDIQTYKEKISIKSEGTQRVFSKAWDNFSSYLDKQKIEFTELISMSKTEMFDILQSWINSESKNNKDPHNIRNRFIQLNGFFYYMGLELPTQAIKQNLVFPTKEEEELYPLQRDEIEKILRASSSKLQNTILSLVSSGMRDGEMMQIRKKDLDMSHERIIIHLPAKITKRKRARSVILSKESGGWIRNKIKMIADEDLVWTRNKDWISARNNLIMQFGKSRKKADLDFKYESTGRAKIVPHSLRAYFFGKARKTHGENYAHMMTGHKGHLMQYDRLSDEEKLEMYIELEPELLIYDQTKNEEKIHKLKEANTKLSDQAEEIKEQNKRIKNLERIWIETNYPNTNRKSQV